jgi:hypothetical protein
MSKTVEVDSSFREKPGHPRSRILVKWLDAAGDDGGSLGHLAGDLPTHAKHAATTVLRCSPASSLKRERLRESWMRENCTSSLSGGRRRALQWAPPPTRQG